MDFYVLVLTKVLLDQILKLRNLFAIANLSHQFH